MQTGFRFGALILAAAIGFAPAALAQVQTGPTASTPNEAARLPGMAVPVSLETQLDARKLKVGDPVAGKLEQDLKEGSEIIVPKNARLTGHVTEVSRKSEGAPFTRLSFLFDSAIAKGGSQAAPIYGVLFDVLPMNTTDNGVERMQQFHLQMMQMAEDHGQPIPANSDIGRTLQELYNNANTGRPTTAAQQYDCKAGTLAGEIWCAPAGHTVMARPSGVGGLDGVFLQKENTAQGPIGVLMSAGKNITVNRGTDLAIYFFMPARKR